MTQFQGNAPPFLTWRWALALVGFGLSITWAFAIWEVKTQITPQPELNTSGLLASYVVDSMEYHAPRTIGWTKDKAGKPLIFLASDEIKQGDIVSLWRDSRNGRPLPHAAPVAVKIKR